MKANSDDINIVLKVLATTPRRLTAASKDLATARLQFKTDENSWSAHEVLAHVRACADVWGKSILAMIAQDHPTLRYVSPRTWIRKTNYLEIEFHESLAAFVKQRNELLAALKALEAEGWLRGATFTATTRGREQTVLSYAQRIAQHENEHCEQIEAILK